jgi:hypothetical protein
MSTMKTDRRGFIRLLGLGGAVSASGLPGRARRPGERVFCGGGHEDMTGQIVVAP